MKTFSANKTYVFKMFTDNGIVIREASESEIKLFEEFKKEIPESGRLPVPIGTRGEVERYAKELYKLNIVFLQIAKEIKLDEIADIYDLKREFGETDSKFRKRILKRARETKEP